MSYEKHTWETGETITAEKLNNLENGVASSGGGGSNDFVVNFEYNQQVIGELISDKTPEQIFTANENGSNVYGVLNVGSGGLKCYLIESALEDDVYVISFSTIANGGVMLIDSTEESNSWSMSLLGGDGGEK